MAETEEKKSIVDQIAEYVDSFLTKRAAVLGIEKKQLSIYLRINQKGELENLLYLDYDKFQGYIKLSQVIGKIVNTFFGNQIYNSITGGFQKFASEKEYDVTKLMLGLMYVNGILCYKAYYDNKPLQINLEEFFSS